MHFGEISKRKLHDLASIFSSGSLLKSLFEKNVQLLCTAMSEIINKEWKKKSLEKGPSRFIRILLAPLALKVRSLYTTSDILDLVTSF